MAAKSGPGTWLKSAIPIIIVIIPIVFLTLCSKSGQNKYQELPYIGYKDVNAKGDTVNYSPAPFVAMDQYGQAFDSRSLKGNIYVVDFIFTRCPNICKQLTANMLKLQESGAKRNDFRLISFTIDPKFDSAAVLRSYAEKHGVQKGRWSLLNAGDSTPSIVRSYLAPMTTESPDKDPLKLQHSGLMILIDKEGHIRGTFDGTNSEEVKRLEEDIYALIWHYEKSGKK